VQSLSQEVYGKKPCERLNHQKYLKEFIGRKVRILGATRANCEPVLTAQDYRAKFDSGMEVLFEKDS
jgi:hypothetical protein